jgi:hypothetical protein
MCQLAVSFVLLLSTSAALRSSSVFLSSDFGLAGVTPSHFCAVLLLHYMSTVSLTVTIHTCDFLSSDPVWSMQPFRRYVDIGILWLFTPEELISGKTGRQSDMSCYTELNFRRMSRLQYWLTHVTNMLWSWRNCCRLWLLTNLSYEATEWRTLTFYLDPRLGLLGDTGVSRLPYTETTSRCLLECYAVVGCFYSEPLTVRRGSSGRPLW